MVGKSTSALLNQHGTGAGSDMSGLDAGAEKTLSNRQKMKSIKTPDSKIPPPLKPFSAAGAVGKRGKMTGMKTAGVVSVMENAGLWEKKAEFGDSIRGGLGMETEADRAERAARIGGAIPLIGGVTAGVGGGMEGGFPGAVGGAIGAEMGQAGGLLGGGALGGGAGLLLQLLSRGKLDADLGAPLGAAVGGLGGMSAGGALGGGAGARWAVENG